MRTQQQLDMTCGPLTKKMITYTLPIICTGVLQLLFNAADLIVVGRFADESSIAAVGATGSLITLIVNMFMGLSVGAGVTIAHAIGAHDDKATRDTVHTAIPMALIGGVVLMSVAIPLAKPLLLLMDNPPEVIGKSTLYMQIYFAGITGNLLYNYGAAILRAVGDTRSPLIFLTISGVVNVLLNLFFVIVFEMDVAGVALATTISQNLSAVLVVIALMRRDDACKFEFRRMKIKKRPLLKMLRIGIPAGIQGSIFSISNVIIQSSINGFGKVIMAGHSAAANIEGFLYTTMNSFYQTVLNFSGQNVGAKKYDRVKKVMYNGLILVFIAGFSVGTLSVIFRKNLLTIYLPNAPESLKWGALRMTILSSTYFLCGLMEVSTGMLRGIGQSIAPMVTSILGVCVFRIGWVFTVFKKVHTLECLYYSYPISWAITLTLQLVMFFILYKRMVRPKYNKNKQ